MGHGDMSDVEREVVSKLDEIVASLPGSEAYVMVHHPAYSVGKRSFAIAGMDASARGPTVSINLGKLIQPGLLAEARFTKTPYIGQHGWVTARVDALSAGELRELVTESWKRVATKKLLRQYDG